LNAYLVVRTGMRAILRVSYLVYACAGLALVVLFPLIGSQTLQFALFVAFVLTAFYVAGLTMGNLNALALELGRRSHGLRHLGISALSVDQAPGRDLVFFLSANF